MAVSELYAVKTAGVESYLRILGQLVIFLNFDDPFDEQLFESINILGLLESIETGRPSILPLTWRRPPIRAERMKRIQTEVDQIQHQGSSPRSSVSGSDPSTSTTIDAIILVLPSPADRLAVPVSWSTYAWKKPSSRLPSNYH
jgi:hypothetical protein